MTLRAGALTGLMNQPSAQVIDGSLKFDNSKTTNLSRTPSSEGNRKTWTWSGWFNRQNIGANDNIFKVAGSSSKATQFTIMIHNGNYVSIDYGGAFYLKTNRLLRDTSGWYHFVVTVDTTLSTADNRIRLYINGVEETSFATRNNPNLNEDLGVNRTSAHTISTGDSSGFDGLLSNFYLIDGAALGPENFGFTDPLTNTWRPKKYNHRTDLYGVTWSSALVGDASGFQAAATAADGFNGKTGTDDNSYAQNNTGSNPSTITFTPVGGIKFNSSIQVYLINAANTVNVNGEGAQSIAANQWVTVKTGSGTLNTLVFSRPSTNGASFGGIRIDGHILIDAQNDNSFYLPMDGNSLIGQDKSGKGNDFTPVNFGGSVALDNPQVSGARPILNTLPGGTHAGVGVFGSKENKYYIVTTANGSVYQFDITSGDNPSLEFIRGATYRFDYSSHTGHPVLFSSSNPDSSTTAYTTGTSIASNVISFTVPHDAPDTLYYYCSNHPTGMNGAISITTDNTKADQYASNCVLALPLVGNANDVSASIACTQTNYSITSNGNASASSDKSNFYNGSFEFDGNGDSLTFTTSSALSLSGDFTIEFWINNDTITTDTQYPSPITMPTDGSGISQVYTQADNDFYGLYKGGDIVTTGNNSALTNVWQHVAFTRSGSTCYAFLNGVLKNTATSSATFGGTSGTYRIGSYNGSGGDVDAYMQDLRIYNGVAKYTSNFVVPATSPDILPDTPSGVSGSSKLTKVTDGAVSFDGGDNTALSIADSTDFDHASSFTWEGYFYLNSYDSSGSSILRHENDGVDWYINTSGNIVFNQNPSTTIVNTGNNVMILNKWVHIAVSHTGSVCKIFVDGVEKGSATTSTVPDNVSGILYIGETGDTNTYQWNGFISNLRFVNGTALYTSRFTPPTAPLTNVTNTKLLCCQSNVFPGGAAVSPNISGLNNGTQWSYYLTTTQGANSRDFYSVASYPASNLFDGDTSTIVYGGWTDDDDDASDLIFSPPGGVAVSSKLEVYVGYYSKIKVNGSDYNTGGQSTNLAWVTVSDGSNFTGTLTELILENTSNANVVRAAAIRIDDSTILIDPVSPKGNAAAITFNPFNTDIHTVRGQETGYATLNPLKVSDTSSIVLSDGNLRVDITGNYYNAVSTLGMSSGKFYCETSPVRGYSYFGIATGDVIPNTWGGDQTNNTAWVLHGNGSIYHNNATTNGTGFPSTSGVAGGYTLGLLFDADNKTMRYVYKGAISKIYNMANTVDGDSYYFFVGGDAGSYEIDVNFGQKPFKFSPPDGFQPLNAANLRPETVIPRSDQFVGLTTYTGSASPQTVGGINFTSDLIWIKSRTHTGWNILQDSVRGFGKILFSNSSNAEVGNANDLISDVSSTGFSVNTNYAGGTDTATTTTSGTNSYVGWCWKAGGSKGTFNIDDVGYASASDVGMNVGGQNSNAYDQSQNWSGNATGGENVDRAFDGTGPRQNHYSHSASSLTVNFSPALSGRIIVYGGTGGGGADTYTLSDGSSLSSAVQYDTSPYFEALDFGVKSNITSLTCSNGYTLYAVTVDGKLLVDSGVTPPNAPLKANTGASVGTRQGFSIIKFTNDSTSPITLSHGLTQAPTFVLLKALTGSVGWTVGHTSIGFTKRLKLNGTDAESESYNYFASTLPTSSLITLGANNVSNDFIMYSWHDVPGLQKFGSYIGNASTNGPFIELGFRPSIVLLKNATGSTNNWMIIDSERGKINVIDELLFASSSGSENTGTARLDFLSNGFKVRDSSGGFNESSQTFVYAAWAEAPTIDLYGGGANAR